MYDCVVISGLYRYYLKGDAFFFLNYVDISYHKQANSLGLGEMFYFDVRNKKREHF